MGSLLLVAIALLVSGSTAFAWDVGARGAASQAVPRGRALVSPDKDSINLRNDLSKRIGRFHRTWREAWQKSLIDRGQVNINVAQTQNDYNFRNFTPEVRRYQALLCYTGWLGEVDMANAEATLYGTNVRLPAAGAVRASATDRMIAASAARSAPLDETQRTTTPGSIGANSLSLENPRRIRGDRNQGQVCPLWVPEEVGLPLDEGERLDLALPIATRPRIRRSRDSIITRLDDAAARYPGDGWIAGQRVRFLLDNVDFDRALLAAQACTSEMSWCRALEGLAYEQSGQLAAADSVFRLSVAAEVARAGVPCADTTVMVLLPAGPRRESRGRSCIEQAELSERVWWMADPLWSVAGNERFVAHHARRTSLALRSAFATDERYVWRAVAAGEALQETIIRYGWPTHTYWAGYQIDSAINIGRESVMMQAEPPYTSKEYAPDRVALLPTFRAIENPFDAKASDWSIVRPDSHTVDDWCPTEHMAFTTPIATLAEGQSIMLRRDTSIVFGVAIDDPVHQLDPTIRVPLRAKLLASTSPRDVRLVRDTVLPFGVSLRVAGEITPEPSVISVEVPGRVPQEIGHRNRFGLRPPPSLSQMAPTDVAVSDPVFVLLPRRGATAPADPDIVLTQMVGSLTFTRQAPVALYWESYGFAPGDSVNVEIRIARRDENSALRSIGAAFGLADARRDSVSIKWREPDPGRQARVLATRVPTVGRSISVDLRNLAVGHYAFIVEMSRPNGVVARGQRRVVIVE